MKNNKNRECTVVWSYFTKILMRTLPKQGRQKPRVYYSSQNVWYLQSTQILCTLSLSILFQFNTVAVGLS